MQREYEVQTSAEFGFFNGVITSSQCCDISFSVQGMMYLLCLALVCEMGMVCLRGMHAQRF